jgi:hypothetical protein
MNKLPPDLFKEKTLAKNLKFEYHSRVAQIEIIKFKLKRG